VLVLILPGVLLAMQNWTSEMAAYVKSLDPNHLLTLGEEGFYSTSTDRLSVNPGYASAQHRMPPPHLAALKETHVDMQMSSLAARYSVLVLFSILYHTMLQLATYHHTSNIYWGYIY
jgi:endo-1,4-beta-mannosidase